MLMGYERQKVAPWEIYADGEWHEVRTGPVGEARGESLRAYSRHRDSVRDWSARNGYRFQLSRRENGRLLTVRLIKDRSELEDVYVTALRPLSRTQIGRLAIEAFKVLDYALVIRMYGERPPGGDENWPEFDRRTETLLRKVRGLEH